MPAASCGSSGEAMSEKNQPDDLSDDDAVDLNRLARDQKKFASLVATEIVKQLDARMLNAAGIASRQTKEVAWRGQEENNSMSTVLTGMDENSESLWSTNEAKRLLRSTKQKSKPTKSNGPSSERPMRRHSKS